MDSPAGPFVFSRGAQISWMLLLQMQETVFVDSPAGHLSSRGGGGGQTGWHRAYTCVLAVITYRKIDKKAKSK